MCYFSRGRSLYRQSFREWFRCRRIMARRPRRRAIVLESSDEDDDSDRVLRTPKFHALHLTNVQASSILPPSQSSDYESGENSETSPTGKLQKSSRQPTVNSLLESRTKLRRTITNNKGTRGTLPLEFVTLPVANSEDSSRKRKAEASDHQRPVFDQYVDHRLWVDKYTPRSVGELVIHSKKVAEVKAWFQGQLLNPYGSHLGSRVLVLTGPAGVGKSAVVHVLADHLGIELFEWTTPAPELWQEYSHHAASGGPYVSKLDEFEAFLERGRKMSSLPTLSVSLSAHNMNPFSGDNRKKRGVKVLVIDDLPVWSNREHCEHLARSLYHLALSCELPAIVVVTDDAGTGDKLGEMVYAHKDVIEALERGGAKKIAFNPVTVNAMKKLLNRVHLLEKCRLSSAKVSALAESSGGDIRQALTSLQFLCVGCHSYSLHHSMWDPGGSCQSGPQNLLTNETNSQERTIHTNKSYASVGGGRDYSLSLFHALGKFLHNKRHTDELFHTGSCAGLNLKQEFQRRCLNMEEPEVVVSQAHAETATLLAFLHENVLQFIDENGTDDVAAVSAYLSDTDYLLGAQGSFRSRYTLINTNDIDPSQVATAAAISVAARGVLFGNDHPAPRRWQSLRAPALWQVERQRKLKKIEITAYGVHGSFDTRGLSGLVQATDLYPFSRLLSRHSRPSSTFAKICTATVNVKDAMDFRFHECEMEDYPDLQLQDKMNSKEEHIEFKATFKQMSVEDDIEDPES